MDALFKLELIQKTCNKEVIVEQLNKMKESTLRDYICFTGCGGCVGDVTFNQAVDMAFKLEDDFFFGKNTQLMDGACGGGMDVEELIERFLECQRDKKSMDDAIKHFHNEWETE